MFASRTARGAILVASVAGATLIWFVAGLIDWLACEQDTSASCDRASLARTQLIVGWAAAAGLVGFGLLQLRIGRRIAIAGLVLVVMLIVGWGMLADAADHGWGDLKFFPF